MTVALSRSSKRSIAEILGFKKASSAPSKRPSNLPLKRHEIARLFAQDMRDATKNVKPAELNASEKLEARRLNELRGALYSGE